MPKSLNRTRKKTARRLDRWFTTHKSYDMALYINPLPFNQIVLIAALGKIRRLDLIYGQGLTQVAQFILQDAYQGDGCRLCP